MKIKFLALVAAASFVFPAVASASTVDFTNITATNGVADGFATPAVRTDLDNAIDGSNTSFYSLGDGGSLTIDLSPLTLVSPAFVIEFTNGSPAFNYPEAAQVFLGTTLAGILFNDGTAIAEAGFTISALGSPTGGSFEVGFSNGAYRSITLVDVTRATYASRYTPSNPGNGGITDGFDVANISVMAAVPLPAGGVLLLAALGGLGLTRRRHRA